MRHNLRTISASLCVGVTLVACAADSTSPNAAGGRQMTISFASGATAGASASRNTVAGSLRSITATSGADALVITKAQLVFARLELQKSGATCTSTADAGDDDHGDDNSCAELELAPSVVDIPVNGTLVTALNVTVPAGSYSALEAKIRAVQSNKGHDGKGTSAFLTAHPEFAGVSVRVEGTFNGKAFTFTGAPRAELETVFNPAITVADSGANITVHLDIATWFTTSSGALIDPSTANAGGVNATLVETNIKRSFHAFRDDDRNGDDDHGEHGGGHN
jgi:hypothetical protein